jgi:hypothetical protein
MFLRIELPFVVLPVAGEVDVSGDELPGVLLPGTARAGDVVGGNMPDAPLVSAVPDDEEVEPATPGRFSAPTLPGAPPPPLEGTEGASGSGSGVLCLGPAGGGARAASSIFSKLYRVISSPQ